jgi:hypothetical protein
VTVLARDFRPVFTRDGLKLYVFALTARVGGWAECVGNQARQWQVRAERRALLGSLLQLTTTRRNSGESGKMITAVVVKQLHLTARRGQSVTALTRCT